jgi:hypothetical protein
MIDPLRHPRFASIAGEGDGLRRRNVDFGETRLPGMGRDDEDREQEKKEPIHTQKHDGNLPVRTSNANEA